MDPLQIDGTEQQRLDPSLPDGGLPPVVGVQSFCVFRASRAVPELTDGKGWTYHHHVDMACWKGRLYVGWNSCEQDEDVWPSRELLSWSIDGSSWSPPVEMFPQGLSVCLRMYFYHSHNGRMLIIAGLRLDREKTWKLVTARVRSSFASCALIIRSAKSSRCKFPRTRRNARGCSMNPATVDSPTPAGNCLPIMSFSNNRIAAGFWAIGGCAGTIRRIGPAEQCRGPGMGNGFSARGFRSLIAAGKSSEFAKWGGL